MNNEDKKLAIIFGFLVLMIALVFVGTSANTNKSNEVFAQHQEVLSSRSKQAIYIGRPTCSYCVMFQPVLDEMSTNYNFEYYYINTDELTEKQITEVLSTVGINPEEFGTPYIAFMEDGVMKDKQVGYVDASTFFLKLKDNGYVNGDYILKETLINYVNYEEYKELLLQQTTQILVVGQTTCSYCIQLKPVLDEILEENSDLVINYIEFDLLNEEEQNDVRELLATNVSEEWGTPTLLLISNNEVNDYLTGLRAKEEYINYFNQNELLR